MRALIRATLASALLLTACAPVVDASDPDVRTEAAELRRPTLDLDGVVLEAAQDPAKAQWRLDPSEVLRDIELPISRRQRHESGELPGQADAFAEWDDPCAARCGEDDGCLILCRAGELAPAARPLDEEPDSANAPAAAEGCLACGRETGFLGAPDHLTGYAENGTVTLEWDEVDGADEYAVHGTRWDGLAAAAVRSDVWVTSETRITLDLDPGIYTFYVLAWDQDTKTRSGASELIRIDL